MAYGRSSMEFKTCPFWFCDWNSVVWCTISPANYFRLQIWASVQNEIFRLLSSEVFTFDLEWIYYSHLSICCIGVSSFCGNFILTTNTCNPLISHENFPKAMLYILILPENFCRCFFLLKNFKGNERNMGW